MKHSCHVSTGWWTHHQVSGHRRKVLLVPSRIGSWRESLTGKLRHWWCYDEPVCQHPTCKLVHASRACPWHRRTHNRAEETRASPSSAQQQCTSSSLSRSPQDWIGMAFSQSPECGAQAAKNLARSRGETQPEKRGSRIQPTTTPSQARCLWDIGSISETEDVLSDQNAKQSSNAVSVNSEIRGTMRFCKANVPQAKAKKADDASEYAVRTPSPSSLTGKLACCHCECVEDTLRMLIKPSRRMLSKRSSKTLSKHLTLALFFWSP